MSFQPCPACPWVSEDPRDKAAISKPDIQQAAIEGWEFICHMRCGPCHGAKQFQQEHKKLQQAKELHEER